MDRQWAKIRSWHIVSLNSDRAGHARLLCGRMVGDMLHRPAIFDIYPEGEKTCETCLRKDKRLQELAAQ